MTQFDFPSNSPIVDKIGKVLPSWMQWITRINKICNASISEGTTAQRPVSGLWVGRRYFDTDLGIPIFVQQVIPEIIWVDGAGLPPEGSIVNATFDIVP